MAGLSTYLAAAVLAGLQAPAAEPDSGAWTIAGAVQRLDPGEFLWAPQLAPEGPMLLVVNRRTQRAILYRNGVPIGISTVSTGRPGYTTPTGVFTILQKRVEHYSSTYDNAPMPYMQRLTWKGIALHAGTLPGYPASHGCIRLPLAFAELLYGETAVGMTVVITDREWLPHVEPERELLGGAGRPVRAPSGEIYWAPDLAPEGPVSVLVSAADRQVLVLRNGVVIGSAPVTIAAPVQGTSAFLLQSVGDGGRQWVPLQSPVQENGTGSAYARESFRLDDAFRSAVESVLRPGTTVIVTADSLVAPGTRETVLVGEP